jgi:hypothetical protein
MSSIFNAIINGLQQILPNWLMGWFSPASPATHWCQENMPNSLQNPCIGSGEIIDRLHSFTGDISQQTGLPQSAIYTSVAVTAISPWLYLKFNQANKPAMLATATDAPLQEPLVASQEEQVQLPQAHATVEPLDQVEKFPKHIFKSEFIQRYGREPITLQGEGNIPPDFRSAFKSPNYKAQAENKMLEKLNLPTDGQLKTNEQKAHFNQLCSDFNLDEHKIGLSHHRP